MKVLSNRRYPQWAPTGTALTGPLPEQEGARIEAVAARLLELARVALAVLDIDAVRDCLLPEARVAAAADDHGYDIGLFNKVKSGLLRVERLSDLAVCTAIWRRRPDDQGKAEVLLVGSTYPPQLIEWDKYEIAIPDPMQAAFEGEPGRLVREEGELCSVFVPLRDSLDDVVAILQVCAALGETDGFV
jgi:hypothetical protein